VNHVRRPLGIFRFNQTAKCSRAFNLGSQGWQVVSGVAREAFRYYGLSAFGAAQVPRQANSLIDQSDSWPKLSERPT